MFERGFMKNEAETSREKEALKRFVIGDYAKIAILEQLAKGEWCTLGELCRIAKNYDKYIGPVRVSTILLYIEKIAKNVLEKSEGGTLIKWRVKPEKVKVIEECVEEVKTRSYRKTI